MPLIIGYDFPMPGVIGLRRYGCRLSSNNMQHHANARYVQGPKLLGAGYHQVAQSVLFECLLAGIEPVDDDSRIKLDRHVLKGILYQEVTIPKLAHRCPRCLAHFTVPLRGVCTNRAAWPCHPFVGATRRQCKYTIHEAESKETGRFFFVVP